MRLLITSMLLFAVACGDEPTETLDAGNPDAGSVDMGTVAAGAVRLSTDTVDLGAVVVNAAREATFTVENPGSEVVLVSLSPPAGPDGARFTRSVNIPEEAGRFRLEPGGVATVTVGVTAQEEGPLLGVLALDSCAGACPMAVLLLADGVLSGVDCPMEVDLGLANPGDCLRRKVSCVNAGNAVERITVVELEPASDAEFEVTEPALPIDFGPGEVLDLDVTYCPEDVASHQGAVTVATFEPFETERTITLLGRGGGADVQCSPASLDFGTVGVGASANTMLVCTNSGFEPAVLEASLETGTEFEVTTPSIMIDVGDGGFIEVSANPTSPGDKADTLRVRSNDPDQPEIAIPLTAIALDLEPCSALLAPPMRDLGLVGIGDVRRASFDVINSGASDCLIRDVAFTRGGQSGYSVVVAPGPGTILAAGETTTVEAQFAPLTNATALGELTISFSNPGTTELVAQLDALGGVTPFSITPSIVDFGPTPLGCAAPAEQTIVLRRLTQGSGSVLNVQIADDPNGLFDVVAAVPAQLDFYETLELTVTFAPTAAQEETAELRIISGTTPAAIRIPIRGEGVAGAMRTETTVMAPRTVDLLMVVDDSCSMGPAQDALALAMPTLDAVLQARAGDLNVGVVTTDMEAAGRSGRMIGGPLAGSDPNFLSELVSRVTPGIDGSGDEQGVRAAYAALTEPLLSGDNAGFIRPGAELAILVVSDENDFSPATPSVELMVGSARQASGSGTVFIAGIVGPPTEDCVGPYGNGDAADRYARMIGRADRGLATSFCDDMEQNVQRIAEAIFGGSSVPVAGRPIQSTLTVTVDGTALAAADWAYDLANRQVVIFDSANAPVGATVEVGYQSICLSPTCYDGTQDPGELCDDGNMADDDACIDCMPALCGDGVVQAGVEACDDGNLTNQDACLTTCDLAGCGDGFLQTGVEDCDDGNVVSGDGCPANCRFYVMSGPTSQAFVPLANGTSLTFVGTMDPDDDGVAEISLPFETRLFDVPTSSLTISVNGFATTAPGLPPQSWVNDAIPDSAAPNGTMAIFWDDLFLDRGIDGGADILTEVLGTAPARTFVVEWRDVRHRDHGTNNHRRWTFQLRIEETTHVITFAYADTETDGQVPTAASASAGIEDSTGSRGLEALGCSPDCDGRPRPPRADGFPEQTVVTFTP